MAAILLIGRNKTLAGITIGLSSLIALIAITGSVYGAVKLIKRIRRSSTTRSWPSKIKIRGVQLKDEEENVVICVVVRNGTHSMYISISINDGWYIYGVYWYFYYNNMSIEENIFMSRVAEKCERFRDMVDFLKPVIKEKGALLSIDERKLL